VGPRPGQSDTGTRLAALPAISARRVGSRVRQGEHRPREDWQPSLNGARSTGKILSMAVDHGGEGSRRSARFSFRLGPSNPSLSDYDAKWKKGVLENNWTEWTALPAVKVYLMNAPQGTEWTTYTHGRHRRRSAFYFTLTRALSRTPRESMTAAVHVRSSHPCPTLGGTNNLTSCAEPRLCLRAMDSARSKS